MTYRITKTFDFAASHQLTHLPEGHQCARLHGHNYLVTVVLEGDELDGNGFVEDYGQLKDVKAFLDGTLDHQHLNDVLTFPTTAENLARALYGRFKKDHPALAEVVVSETPKTTASYRP